MRTATGGNTVQLIVGCTLFTKGKVGQAPFGMYGKRSACVKFATWVDGLSYRYISCAALTDRSISPAARPSRYAK